MSTVEEQELEQEQKQNWQLKVKQAMPNAAQTRELTWLRGGGGFHWRRCWWRLRVGCTLIQGEQQHGQGYEGAQRLVAQALPAPHVASCTG